jgi:hypothetical protein
MHARGAASCPKSDKQITSAQKLEKNMKLSPAQFIPGGESE